MENMEEKDRLETTSVTKEDQREMAKSNEQKKDSELTDEEVAAKLEGEQGNEPTPEGDETPAEDSTETEAPVVEEMTEEQVSATSERLVELNIEVDEAVGMFGIAKSEGVKSGLRVTLLEQAKEAEEHLLKYGQFHTWTSEVIGEALTKHTPRAEAEDGEVHVGSMGFRLIPETFEEVLEEIVTEGKRPHSCEFC